MSRQKKQHHEDHVDESWLIPYADLLTLLLALFIVLFASSNLDQAKAESIEKSMKMTLGVFDKTGDTSLIDTNIGSEGGLDVDGNKEEEKSPEAEQELTKEEKQTKTLDSIKEGFESYISEQNLGGSMELRGTKTGLYIILTSDVWFDSGSANISQSHVKVAKDLIGMINKQKDIGEGFKIIVTGHTDNTPFASNSDGDIRSNWQLSVMRAVNFMQIMIENTNISPAVFSARGMGEFDPINSNDTLEGRQKNRRVEVYLSFENNIEEE